MEPDDTSPQTPGYADEHRRAILSLAREGLRAAAAGRSPDRPADCPPELLEPRGCFVTLHNGDRLRGCIGTFEADAPLADNILAMSRAVLRDPRFIAEPVTADEIDELTVEVSVLTPRRQIDDPADYELGVDGIYVIGKRFGTRVAGCFLPDVATEQGWDLPTTLSMLCAHKMGLDPEAWRPPTSLRFYRFRSIKVTERE